MPSRRDFIENSLSAAAGMSLVRPRVTHRSADSAPHRGFLDLLQPPDLVVVQSETGEFRLDSSSGGHWANGGVVVATVPEAGALSVRLSAPTTAIKRLHLRWHGRLADVRFILGDAWERGYGDLEWRGWAPDRVMPWYVATTDGSLTHAYGVRTGARAFCLWQLDPDGVSLWADVRSGALGVRLGERLLNVCDVVCRSGGAGESAFAALHAFCVQMCPKPRLPAYPVYGHNDWYWAYGNNSAETVLVDAQRIVELSPAGANRPFSVIDDGWQPGRGRERAGIGTWDRGNAKFPDMPALA